MSLSTQSFTDGVERTVTVNLATTAATAITPVIANNLKIIYLHCATSAAAAITIDIYDGTTATLQVQAHPLAAPGSINTNGTPSSAYSLERPIILNSKQSLRVTASVALVVNCTLTYVTAKLT